MLGIFKHFFIYIIIVPEKKVIHLTLEFIQKYKYCLICVIFVNIFNESDYQL